MFSSRSILLPTLTRSKNSSSVDLKVTATCSQNTLKKFILYQKNKFSQSGSCVKRLQGTGPKSISGNKRMIGSVPMRVEAMLKLKGDQVHKSDYDSPDGDS